ncbi:hypothetical protein [Aeromonas veronii]|uniref:hypothetical protein n=1 Tax=Aeromonas TaxID=642 RepID=UPI003B3BE768
MNEKINHKQKHLERFIPRNEDGSEPDSWQKKHTCFRCFSSYCLKEAEWVRVDYLIKRVPSCPKCGCKVLVHQPSQEK